MTAQSTLELIRVLITLAVIHQSVESLVLRKAPYWSWSVVRDDYRGWPAVARTLLDQLAARPRFVDSLVVVAALSSLAVPVLAPVLLFVMLTGVVVASLRVRGSIGGASDCMTLHVLAAVWIGKTANSDTALVACVYFVAVQSILSYFLAGLGKIRHPDWRSGVALARYTEQLARPGYASLVKNPSLALAGAWVVLGFECFFPLVLFSRSAAIALVAVAAVFHMANALIFGLHRFVLPWIATFPAIAYVASI